VILYRHEKRSFVPAYQAHASVRPLGVVMRGDGYQRQRDVRLGVKLYVTNNGCRYVPLIAENKLNVAAMPHFHHYM
jgi:hypothetical protein